MKRRKTEVIESSPKSTPNIDLVYPFFEDSSNISSINPPLLKSPFYDDNGYLAINVSSPITITNGNVSLSYDSVFEIRDGKLCIKLNSPLNYSSNGLTLNVIAPISLNDNGIYLNTLESSAFSVINGKLNLNTDSSLITLNNSLGVNVNSSGCISSSQNGLTLSVNESQFNTQGNILNLNPQSFTMSSGEHNNFSALVFTNISQNGNRISLPCAYKFTIVSAFGVAYASISIKLTCDRVHSLIPQNNRNDVPSFTFWMCLNDQATTSLNFSQCFNYSYSSDRDLVIRNIIPSSSNVWIGNPSINSNGYMGLESGNYLFGKPNLIGSIANNYTSKVSVTFMSSNAANYVIPTLTLTLEPSGGSSQVYFYNQTSGEVTFGPFQFSYSTS